MRTTPDSNEVSNFSSQTAIPSVPRCRQTLCLFEMISMHRQLRWNDSRVAGMAQFLIKLSPRQQSHLIFAVRHRRSRMH